MQGSNRRAYCPTCGEERRILRTVDWQEDTCLECGTPVSEESIAGE